MDLGTIGDKLKLAPEAGGYPSLASFLGDVRQVWENCRLVSERAGGWGGGCGCGARCRAARGAAQGRVGEDAAPGVAGGPLRACTPCILRHDPHTPRPGVPPSRPPPTCSTTATRTQ